MILIIGGRSQGKLDYVMTKTGETQVAADFESAKRCHVFNKVHTAVQEMLSAGKSPEKELESLLAENPDVVLICDEVGGGVIPADPEGRAWRETVGRLCYIAAQRAKIVERVFCGIPMRLKGEGEWS